jgi:asparagine synthetase B (glutamine-hydrolysing)
LATTNDLALASPAIQFGEEFEPRKKRKTRKKVEASRATYVPILERLLVRISLVYYTTKDTKQLEEETLREWKDRRISSSCTSWCFSWFLTPRSAWRWHRPQRNLEKNLNHEIH